MDVAAIVDCGCPAGCVTRTMLLLPCIAMDALRDAVRIYSDHVRVGAKEEADASAAATAVMMSSSALVAQSSRGRRRRVD